MKNPRYFAAKIVFFLCGIIGWMMFIVHEPSELRVVTGTIGIAICATAAYIVVDEHT